MSWPISLVTWRSGVVKSALVIKEAVRQPDRVKVAITAAKGIKKVFHHYSLRFETETGRGGESCGAAPPVAAHILHSFFAKYLPPQFAHGLVVRLQFFVVFGNGGVAQFGVVLAGAVMAVGAAGASGQRGVD